MNVDEKFLQFIYFPKVYVSERMAFLELRLGFAVPEIIDPVFAKTSQNARFLLSENERFGLFL
jgi:hypothetical protein